MPRRNPLAVEVGKLSAEVEKLRAQVKAMHTQPRLANASLEGTSIPVTDGRGNVMHRIGSQGDGSYGDVAVASGPQPKPSAPRLTPGTGTISVRWDGRAEYGAPPKAFGRVEVWGAPGADAAISDATHLSSIYSREGGSTTVRATDGPWTVWLRMVGPDGATVSIWSEPATATLEKLVDEDDIRARLDAFAGGELDDAAYSSLMARLGEFLIVRAGQIDANAIEAMHIAAGAIDGQVITGATVQTQRHATRGTKMTNEGFVGYSASGGVTVWIDGEQVRLSAPTTIIDGDIEARSLALRGALTVGTSGEGRLTPATGGRLRIEGRVPDEPGSRDTFTTSSTPFFTPGTGLNSTSVTYSRPTPTGTRVPIVTPNLATNGSVAGLIACSTRSRTGSGFTLFTQRLFSSGQMPSVSLSYLSTWGSL